MLPASYELASAIEAPERQPVARVSIDWDGDGHDQGDDVSALCESISIERVLAGELPDEVRIVEGTAAASLTVDLGGGDPLDETKHAAWLFSSASPESPLAGRERLARPLVADIGMMTSTGPEMIRRFTGLTRSLSVDSGRRAASVSGLDYRELFRFSTAPLVVSERAGPNGTWIIGRTAYEARTVRGGKTYTFDASPRPVAPDVFIPCWGSLEPFTRSAFALLVSAQLSAPGAPQLPAATFVPGRYVLAADARPGPDFRAVGWTLGIDEGGGPRGTVTWTGVTIGFWARRVPGDPPSAMTARAGHQSFVTNGVDTMPRGTVTLGVGLDHRLMFSYAYNPNGFPGDPGTVTTERFGPTLPDDGAWHYVGVRLDKTAGTVGFNLDGATSSATFTPDGRPMRAASALMSYMPISDIALWHRGDAPWHHDPAFTPTARIDPSTLDLVGILDGTPREAWKLIQEIAAAEQASAYFDEDGKFVYRTRPTSATTSTARTLTAADSLLSLAESADIDRVRNIITTRYRPVRRDPAEVYILQARDVITVPANSSVDVWFAFDKPVYTTFSTINMRTPPQPGDIWSYITWNTAANGTGTAIDDDALRAQVQWEPTRCRIRFINGTATTLYTANNTNGPTIVVEGKVLAIGPEVEVTVSDPASIAVYGPQPLTIEATPWTQSETVAARLAAAVLGDLAYPSPVLADFEIVGDPRLALGDRVRIQDRDGLALDGWYWIVGIRDRFTATAYSQTITARQDAPALSWDVAGWDSTAWGD